MYRFGVCLFLYFTNFICWHITSTAKTNQTTFQYKEISDNTKMVIKVIIRLIQTNNVDETYSPFI